MKSVFNWLAEPRSSVGVNTDAHVWDPRVLNAISSLGGKTLAGENVDPQSAMRLAPYYACLKVISEDLAKLPFEPFVIKNGKRQLDSGSDAWVLLKQPSKEMTEFSFMETLVQYMLAWGNGFALIKRDGAGRAREMDLIHPGRVRAKRINDRVIYEVLITNNPLDLGFTLATSTKMMATIPQEDMLHIHGLGNGFWGYSVAQGIAKETIGYGLALRDFGATFFGNSANGGFVLEHPGTLSKTAKEGLKKSVGEEQIGPFNAHKLKILEEGMKLTRVTIPPNEAQFLESLAFSISEIARFFRVPLSKLQDLEKATFNTLEMQNRDYVTDTLSPNMIKIEQEFDWKIYTIKEKRNHFTKFNPSSLLRGNQKEQSLFYKTMFDRGLKSINEIRDIEGDNALDNPEADFHWVPLNVAPIEEDGHKTARENMTSVPPNLEENPDAEEGRDITEEDSEGEESPAAFDVRPMVHAQARRIIEREINSFARIGKKYEIGSDIYKHHVNDFLSKHRTVVFESFASIFDCLGQKKDKLSLFSSNYLDKKVNLHKKGGVKGPEKDGFVNELSFQIIKLLRNKE